MSILGKHYCYFTVAFISSDAERQLPESIYVYQLDLLISNGLAFISGGNKVVLLFHLK